MMTYLITRQSDGLTVKWIAEDYSDVVETMVSDNGPLWFLSFRADFLGKGVI